MHYSELYLYSLEVEEEQHKMENKAGLLFWKKELSWCFREGLCFSDTVLWTEEYKHVSNQDKGGLSSETALH